MKKIEYFLLTPLLFSTFLLSISSAFADSTKPMGAEIRDRKTGEILSFGCGNVECSVFDLELSIGGSMTVIRKGIIPKSMSASLAHIHDRTGYFPITKELNKSEDAPIFYIFPLVWPVTLILTGADALYSGGAYLTNGLPVRIAINKLKKDVKRLANNQGQYVVSDRRFQRLKEFFLN